MTSDRPHVVVSVQASMDGRVTLRRDCLLMAEDAARVWESLRPPSAAAVDAARAAGQRADAILEGSGSLVAGTAGPLDDLPAVTGEPDLYADFLPEAVRERPGHEKWFAVVDGRGRVRWTMTRNAEFDLLVLVARGTPAAYLAYLRAEGISYLVAGQERVDLGAALRRMRARLGVTRVVSHAGGELNAALLRAGLVDEIDLLVLPAAIGGLGTPAIFDGPPLGDGEVPVALRLLGSATESDGTVRLRYEVR
jgi:riboflavin biosynthesis pyrimidine reductase